MNRKKRSLKGWKTIGFNIAMGILAAPDVLALIPPKYAIPIMTIGNVVLRAVTTTPIGRNE